MIEDAYAGDIIGVFDPGIFSIGDTIVSPSQKFEFEGIPTFAPEHFARVRQMDTISDVPLRESRSRSVFSIQRIYS